MPTVDEQGQPGRRDAPFDMTCPNAVGHRLMEFCDTCKGRPRRRDEGDAMERAIAVARRTVAADADIPDPFQLAVRYAAEVALVAAAPIIAADAAERAREEALAPIRALLEHWHRHIGLDDDAYMLWQELSAAIEDPK